MKLIKNHILLFVLNVWYVALYAQIPMRSIRLESDSMIEWRTYCKSLPLLQWEKGSDRSSEDAAVERHELKRPVMKGTVRYDFLYRSLVDTPFYQRDFSQHTIGGNMNFTVLNTYPLQASFQAKKSNSPYFRQVFDVNLQFRGQTFLSNIKDDLIEQAKVRGKRYLQQELESYEQQLQVYQKEVASLREWVDDPAHAIGIMKEREKELTQKAKIDSSVQADLSMLLDYQDLVNPRRYSIEQLAKREINDKLDKKDVTYQNLQERKKELAIKEQELRELGNEIRTIRAKWKDSTEAWKKKIYSIKDGEELREYLSEMNPDAKVPAGWKVLTAINHVGVGRTWADLSELTVKNVSLTGAQVEANPSKVFLAAGAGRMNARYRDFVLRDKRAPSQSLFFGRIGFGRKKGTNTILTFYNGQKSLLQVTNGNTSPLQKVMGLSLETTIVLDKNNWASLEIARSSYYDAPPESMENLMRKVFNLRERSNEAYAVKLGSYWRRTKTRLSGMFRKSGRHFQSFNLQPTNSEQESYQMKVEQELWRRKLLLIAGLRKNDFTNPFIAQGINSKTVFKTATVVLRIPRWPMLTVSYFPSSQLTIMGNNVLVENQYNALTGILSYAYKAGRLNMTTSTVYLQFFNRSSDTAFLYYNTRSLSVQHSVFAGVVQSETGFSTSWQQEVVITTLSQSAGLQLKKWLNVTAGIKYNHLNHSQTAWGATTGVNIIINKFATLQLLYDKSHLPGPGRKLVPVDMGRAGVIKTF